MVTPDSQYTGDSPLKGKGQVPVHVIDYWLTVNAKRVAERNGLRDFKLPSGIGRAYVSLGQETGLNHDLLVAQMAKETAFGTSQIFRDKLNPAGLGAVNDNAYEGAITFETVRDGVRAQFAHMLSYVDGDGHIFQEHSVRHEILRDVGYLGVVAKLSHLNQRWAWSPPEDYAATPEPLRYGQSIARWANQLLTVYRNYEDLKGGDAVTDIDLPYHDDIGVTFREDGPFAAYWRMLVSRLGWDEALMLIGFPITEEFEGPDGVTMQYTERTRLEHHPGAFPEHNDVLLGHLGREDVKLKNERQDRLDKIEKIEQLLEDLR